MSSSPNNILNPLGFQSDSGSVLPVPKYHRKDYAYGAFYPLCVDTKIMPFQFVVSDWASVEEYYGGVSVKVTLYDSETKKGIAVSDESSDDPPFSPTLHKIATILEEYYTEDKTKDIAVFKCPEGYPVSEMAGHRRCYLDISINGYVGFISEDFTVLGNGERVELADDNYSRPSPGFVKLCYRNSTNLEYDGGYLDFSDDFIFRVAVKATIGKPDYQYEEEVTERGGYAYMESQVSKKVYRFTFIAPEYLCDALRVMRLCDERYIVDSNAQYKVTNMNMEVEWQEQGDLAAVTIEFETDNVIANIGGYKAK